MLENAFNCTHLVLWCRIWEIAFIFHFHNFSSTDVADAILCTHRWCCSSTIKRSTNIGATQKTINGRVASVTGEMILSIPIRKRVRATPKARTWKDSCRYFFPCSTTLPWTLRRGTRKVQIKYFEEAKDGEIHSNYTLLARQNALLVPLTVIPPNRSLKTANDESPIHQARTAKRAKINVINSRPFSNL